MIQRRQRRSRPGFTLLEVVLATAIAVLLLGALYVAVEMQLGYAQMSRDSVEESTLARALAARIENDASHVVGLSDPARYRFAAGVDTVSTPATPVAASSTNSSSSSSSSSTTTSTAGTSASGTSSFGSTSSSSDASGVTNIVLPLGVEGDSETLHLFVSNLPREIYSSGANFSGTNTDGSTPPVVSDLRRISYWLAGGDDSPAGLARQDVGLATSDNALQNLPPGIDGENSYVIADEVRSLNFQYVDGPDWSDSWDSTELGPDGVTPIGSPVAIAVTIGVAQPHTGPGKPGAETVKTYRHVVLIPTANGAAMLSQAQSGASSTPPPPTPSTTNGGGVSP